MTVHTDSNPNIDSLPLKVTFHWKAHLVFPVAVSITEPSKTAHTHNIFWRWITSGNGTALLLREPRLQGRKCQQQPLALIRTSPGDLLCLCHAHRPIAALSAAPTRGLTNPVTNCNRIGVGLPLSL